MKFAELFDDTSVRPFRFAVVLAVVLVTIMLCQPAKSQEVNWTTSYQDAIEKAKKTDAPILLYFTGSDWCPWCKKLSQEVFKAPEFAAWVDMRVVPTFVDFPKKSQLPANLSQQNNELLERYRPHLTGFPTALFIKPDGTVIGKLGYEQGGVRHWIQKAQPIVAKQDKST